MRYLGNLLINCFYIYFFISILVNQYYSLKRFIKVSLGLIFNKYNIVICLVSLVTIVFIKDMYLIYYLLNLGFCLLFIVINKPLKFKKTRRNLTLLILSLLLALFIIPIYTFTSLLTVILIYLLLLPIEKLINKRYIRLAKEKIKRIDPFIIGITGSYGKTTFKNILFDVLKTKYNVVLTRGNINTPLGITKFINQELKDDTEIFIVELGIDEINGMSKFKDIVSLDIGVITSIGENHLASFKTLNNTFKAKLKIKSLLKENGNLYLNFDDEYLSLVEEKEDIVFFSKGNTKEKGITIDGLKIEFNDKEILIPLYGKYVYSYLDGIIKIGEFLGLNKDYITLGLNQIRKINRRLEVNKFRNGYFINDSYNININGVKESINLLSLLEGSKVVIIGGIIEQGKNFVVSNNKIKELLKGLDVIFIGDNNHPLVIKHEYSNLYIVSSLKDAYTLIDKLSYTNILLLAKSDDFYLR